MTCDLCLVGHGDALKKLRLGQRSALHYAQGFNRVRVVCRDNGTPRVTQQTYPSETLTNIEGHVLFVRS